MFLLIVAPTRRPNTTLLITPRRLNGVLLGSGRIAPDGVVIVERRYDFDIKFVCLKVDAPRNRGVTRCNSILSSFLSVALRLSLCTIVTAGRALLFRNTRAGALRCVTSTDVTFRRYAQSCLDREKKFPRRLLISAVETSVSRRRVLSDV